MSHTYQMKTITTTKCRRIKSSSSSNSSSARLDLVEVAMAARRAANQPEEVNRINLLAISK